MRILVVGAGMAGLACARSLGAAGHDVVVVEAAPEVGGRMASRRLGSGVFDHGAQHFSVRSPEFAEEVGVMETSGVVRVWFEAPSLTEPHRGVEPRYVGHPTMQAVCAYLASGLEVLTSIRLHELSLVRQRVVGVGGRHRIEADAAVVTAPVPVTLQLLAGLDLGTKGETLRSIEYDPCLVALVTLDGPSMLPQGHLAVEEGPVAWIADNQHKGISPTPTVTIHSTGEYAGDRLDMPEEAWLPDLLRAAAPHLGGQVVDATSHRWRHSLPVNPISEGAIAVVEDPPIVVAGEALAGARVEGAFLSGQAAARLLS